LTFAPHSPRNWSEISAMCNVRAGDSPPVAYPGRDQSGGLDGLTGPRRCCSSGSEEPTEGRRLEGRPRARPGQQPSVATRCCARLLRLYVPFLAEATHPRCGCEGYPEWAGQSLKQGG